MDWRKDPPGTNLPLCISVPETLQLAWPNGYGFLQCGAIKGVFYNLITSVLKNKPSHKQTDQNQKSPLQPTNQPLSPPKTIKK